MGQRPARPASFSSPNPPPPPRPTSSPRAPPTPQPSLPPSPTPRRAPPTQTPPQQPQQQSLRGSTSVRAPSNSALGNLQAIAAGEKPTLVVRNRGRGQVPGRSASRPTPRPTSNQQPITPAFQQAQPTAKPVVNPFVNLELVTFPAVPRRGPSTEAPELATSPSRATTASSLRA